MLGHLGTNCSINICNIREAQCDLCLDTPFWSETGGPGGKQACVEYCPMQALAFTANAPGQLETAGYEVNLK